jgi:hypothetical protein
VGITVHLATEFWIYCRTLYLQVYGNSATSHPNLPFYFIVNPNSGPGGLYTQPDANYQACVPKLRGNPNVKLIGYIATKYGNKDRATVEAEVDTYAQWKSAYKLDGIFFDEVLAQSSARTIYSGYTSYAKSKIPNAFVCTPYHMA